MMGIFPTTGLAEPAASDTDRREDDREVNYDLEVKSLWWRAGSSRPPLELEPRKARRTAKRTRLRPGSKMTKGWV